MPLMDKNWTNWVNENLQRHCDPLEISQILLNNKFTLVQIRKVMGEMYSAELNEGGGETHEPEPAAQTTAGKTESDPLALKCKSLVEIQRDLARLSPKARTIERRRGVSGQEFLEKYYAANRPVILCDLMTFWQAPQKWTSDYLKAICGEEVVEIMASRETNPRYEMDDAPHRKEVKFSEYVDMVNAGKETNDYYMTARNGFFSRQGVRPLLKDIEMFTEYLKETQGDGVYMWYGPKGTITPLHHDTMNIFMAQVQGRKQIKLIPANEVELVYNDFAVYSQVDAGHPDLAQFPKYQYANVIELELEPGEVLFLPVGWWHWVKSLDKSITVSFNNFLFPNDFEWENPGGSQKAAGDY